MIKEFDSIDELVSHIQDDKKTPRLSFRRYPVRFIFLPNLWILKDLVHALVNIGIYRIELEDSLPGPDGWLTIDDIMNIFKKLDSKKDHVVISFSELTRFCSDDDFIGILNKLSIEIENTELDNQERRLYIPMIGIFERFSTTFSCRREWAPIWRISGKNDKIEVFLTDFLVKESVHFSVIENTRDWLSLWKGREKRKIICHSRSLFHLCKNAIFDKAFEIEKVEDIKDLISRIMGIDIPIVYRDKDKEYWNYIWDIENENLKNFNEIIRDKFNRVEIGKSEIMDLWLDKKDKFSRWLLKWYVIGKKEWKDSYISGILMDIENLEDSEIIEHLWYRVFKFKDLKKEIIDERKEYLQTYYSKYNHRTPDIEEKLKLKLNEIDDFGKKLRLLTNISPYERKLAVEITSELRGDREDCLIILKEVYPHLYYYLTNVKTDNIGPENKWVEDYFKEYRWSKIENSKSTELKRILSEKNSSKETFYQWYYSFQPTHFFLMNEKYDRVVWIDALGVEWLPLLTNIIEDNGLIVEKKYICRANLPTDTESNRFENARYVHDLDSYVHSKLYRYPDSLIEEIEVVGKIIKENLSSNGKTLIVSDHGLTVFARAVDDNVKKYDFKDASHEGRYVWTENDMLEDADFVIHIPGIADHSNNRKCVIALRHSSLHDLAKREVHGGATPEEVLVPVILVSRGTRKTISYKVAPQEQDISIRNPTIHLSIEPFPDIERPLAYGKDRTFDFEYDSTEDKWSAILEGLKTGKYELEIRIGDWTGKISIEIKGGMKERDLL
ncbi:MAG: BREX-4 system phosphatase PglZ [Theionarchaea archaeon]|nr:BREX-4 system phosphatase PglZ [Theionarchaea archaeon]